MPAGFGYVESEYKAKIETLKGYVGDLEGILRELTEKKRELTNFWDDDEGVSYQNVINDNIRACKTAIFNTNVSIKALQEKMTHVEGAEKDAKSMIDDAQAAADILDKVTPDVNINL